MSPRRRSQARAVADVLCRKIGQIAVGSPPSREMVGDPPLEAEKIGSRVGFGLDFSSLSINPRELIKSSVMDMADRASASDWPTMSQSTRYTNVVISCL